MQRFLLFLSIFIYFVIIILPTTATAQIEGDTVQYTMADTVLANKLFREVKELFKEEKWKEAEEKGEIVKHIYLELFGEESEEVADILEQLGGIAHFQGKQDIAVKTIEKVLEIRSKILDPSDPEIVRCYHNLGYFFESEWQFEKAIQYYQTGLDICLKYLDPQHLDVAESYYKLGNIYNEKGEYTEAIKSYFEVLEIYSAHYSSESSEMADLYESIGIAYENAGDPNKAIEFKEKSLNIRLRLLGSEHIDVASSYNNLSYSYNSLGKYDEAIELSQKALKIRLNFLGYDHLNVADTYSNLCVSYYYKGDYDKAIEYTQKALDIEISQLGINHPAVAESFNNLSVLFQEKGEYDKAIEFQEKALNIRLNTLGIDHIDISDSYNNLGTIYQDKGEYDKAIFFYQKSMDMRLRKLGDRHPNTAMSYNNLGNVYMDKGNYDQAILFHQKALNVRLDVLNAYHPDIGLSYNNLGNVYAEKGQYDKAFLLIQKALDIYLESLGDEHVSTAMAYGNLGRIYSEKGDYEKAILFHQKALNIILKLFGSEHPLVAYSYINIGVSYADQHMYKEAMLFYQKALDIRLKVHGDNHPDVAITYNNLGSIHFDRNEYEEAFFSYLEALKACGYKNQDFSEVNSLDYLLYILKGLILCTKEQYLKSKDTKYIDSSLNFVSQAIAALNYLASTLIEDSQIFWQDKSYPIYEQSISTNLLKADITQDSSFRLTTFNYSEKSKASQLQAQLKAAEALAFAGIPDRLTQNEYDLRIDITWREKQRQALLDQGKSETDTTVLRISSIIFDLRQEYDSLKQRLEKDYPDYYRAKYDLSTVSVDYVQDSLLRPNQSLVEYFVGDSSIFIFLVQPEYYEVVQVDKEPEFEQWVEDMTRNGIYGYYALKPEDRDDVLKDKSLRNYSESAHRLYEKLIAPVKAKLKKDKLIIIPDGVLGYVPFEALLTERPVRYDAIGRYKYLLEEHQISYCYSATLLREMRNRKHKQEPSQELLAMAPFFLGDVEQLVSYVDTSDVLIASLNPTRDSLDALPNSGEEVAKITSLWDGTPKYAKDATMELFQKTAGEYRILHLSTHGEADDRVGDYAYLAFGMPAANGTFEKLYARDLYNLSLNADMVVLSACETGIGKLQRGEGIISLARAFAYAGAKSIVTTLWKVKDQQTKDLAVSFYKYLHNRKSKDEALQLAKREFLEKNKKNTELLHPYFWAGFIGIGDMSAIR